MYRLALRLALRPCAVCVQQADLFARFYNHLPPMQLVSLAGAWHAWRATRRALDIRLQHALLPLGSLPGFPQLRGIHLLMHIAPEPVPASPSDGTMRRGGACGPAAAPAPTPAEQLQQLAGELLGASAAATAAAGTAASRLSALQRCDSAALREWAHAAGTSSLFFSLEQLLLLSSMLTAPQCDWLHVCRMAAEELRRCDTERELAGMLDL